MSIAQEVARPRKRIRTDLQPKDKFNISNDQFYEVSKEGGRHRVRQTFGQLVVEHAYPAQKLQLPFVSLLAHSPGVLTETVLVVQDTAIQTGSTFFPQTGATVPFQHRDSLREGPHGEEEEGPGGSQSRQGRRHRRRVTQNSRPQPPRYQQLRALGVF